VYVAKLPILVEGAGRRSGIGSASRAEVWVRGAQVTAGYDDDPELTAVQFRDDGLAVPVNASTSSAWRHSAAAMSGRRGGLGTR
jgi:hypothetical protein